MRTLPLILLLAIACPELVRAQAPAAPPADTALPAQAAPPPPPPPPEAFPQQAPAPGAAPAPPPVGYGYGYAPPPLDPARARTLTELQTVDLRIAEVRKQQHEYSIVGPAVMTGAGYGLAVAFSIVAVFEWALAEDIQNGNCSYYQDRYDYDVDSSCDINNDHVIDSDDRHLAQTLARTFGGLSIAAAGVGVVGTVFLMKRLAKRRTYTPELRDLGVRRGQLLQQLRYGGSYSQNGGMQLTVGGRF